MLITYNSSKKRKQKIFCDEKTELDGIFLEVYVDGLESISIQY